MRYEDVLESFEGPLDLLYHLIEKERVDIYDIPISKITSQYIFHIQSMKELDLEVTSEFLVMATTLIEIKSKMLLPVSKELREERDTESTDPREELVMRLIEYKKYKEVSLKLKKRETTCNMLFYKRRDEIEYIEDELSLEGVKLETLLNSYEKLLESCEETIELEYREIVLDEVTIEESIKETLNILKTKRRVRFEELFNKPTKSRIVTAFLALLELIKQKSVIIRQEGNFKDIVVELKNKDS